MRCKRPGRIERCWPNLSGWRHAILLFVASAFLVQSFVTQTHIHPLPVLSKAVGIALLQPGAGKVAKDDQRGPSRDKLPGSDDAAKCPLCQAVGFSGQFVWPTAAAFLLPAQAASIVPIAATILLAHETDSHSWRSRAPPVL